MALQLVYGRSGTGKSEYCFNMIKELIETEKIYIITPEQFSFTAEKKLLDILGKNSVMNAEVLSFNRLAERILKDEEEKKEHLSKCAKSMIIYNILSRNKFKFLTNPETNIQIAINAISELKKHNVEYEKLNSIEIEDRYLKTKLEDIFTLYKAYQDNIYANYIDENDILTLLERKLDEDSEELEQAVIIIDEFVGFTPQEYNIIKKLFKIAKDVIITVPADVEETTNLDDLTMDEVFYESKRTASKLIKCAREAEVEIIKPVILKEAYRFKTEDLKHLEKNIYANIYEKYKMIPDNINIFLAKNPYSEIENVAMRSIKIG